MSSIRQKISNSFEGILDELSLRRAPGLPNQLHLSVTDRCFLPCLHCDIWKNEAVDLPTDDWFSIIDRLGAWCAPAGMNFVGGETLLRTDLEQLVSRAVGHGFEVSFNTNGWLVNQKRARSLSEAGASIAYVSLDGFLEETVDHSRGKRGSYQKARDAIAYFQDCAGIRVIVASILHAGNANEFSDLLSWVQEEGLQLVVQPLYQNFGDVAYEEEWWKSNEMWPRSEKELRAVTQCLDMLIGARQSGYPVCNEAMQLEAMKFHFRHPERDSGVSCRAGHSDLSFDPQGRIRLCYFLDPIGSMFEEVELDWIWKRAGTLRRRWQVSRCERHCNLLNCNFGT
ncbi:MAG: radical SAM protein [Myxococcota bacterium]|nr:radical SAM protein [Myxococcota bacterium]